MATKIHNVGCIFLFTISLLTFISAESDLYIIHMNLSAMPNVFIDHHNWYLATLSSISDTSESSTPTNSKLIYTYTNCAQGFSASLTDSELEVLKNSPGYISSTKDCLLTVHTTHTPQFLGLSPASGSWPAPNYGEDIIIGLADSGIWPESDSFNDEGMSEVPSRWKGKCEPGTNFSSSLCNKKLIGARFFNKGVLAKYPDLNITMNSTRDTDGHGTHTSSIAAGNYVKGASFFGYANGTARGIAPKARIAMYKVLWDNSASSSDVLAAIDQAIQDGVDLLSLSFSFNVNKDSVLDDDPIAVATFAAVQKGIFVAASAGNGGPDYFSVYNGAPWLTTVAAGTIDRKLGGVVTLANGDQFAFASLYLGNSSLSHTPLVFLGDCGSEDLVKNRKKIVVCEAEDPDDISFTNVQVQEADNAGVKGAIFLTNDLSLSQPNQRSSFRTAFINMQDGEKIIQYIQNSKDPRGTIQYSKTALGTKPAPMVDDYSSRGPFLTLRNILKPDILAPGTLILGSWSPVSSVADVHLTPLFRKFNLVSGTSMSTPHVAGVAAIIKKVHPDWSPAAIRSAIMTTANSLDNTLSPIKDAAGNNLTASPLALGAGHINPIKALDPGLIYDVIAEDYIKLLCAMNYTAKQIQTITGSTYNCVKSSLDLNYPSFIALFRSDDDSNENTTVVREYHRTLTNVGDGVSSYTAKVTGMDGLQVTVKPQKLLFKKKYEKLSFKLIVQGPKFFGGDGIGSLSWVHDNGKYVVRSPIVVTTVTPE